MRFLLSLMAVAFAWSMATENAAAAPRYPWWWTRFGKLTHAHILAVQAAEAAAAAAAAAAQQTSTTTTLSTGMIVMVNAGTLTLNTSAAVALDFTGVVISRTLSGTGTLTFNTGVNVVTANNVTVAPLGVTYSGASGAFSFNNQTITDSTSGTHTTTLNGSGTFTGTLTLSSGVTTMDLTNVTGTLVTDSFNGGTYTGSATLSIGSGSSATLTLPDGTIFNLGPAPTSAN